MWRTSDLGRSVRSMDSARQVDTAPTEAASTVIAATEHHLTELVEQGAFVFAQCTCGWRSYARRSRPRARDEGDEHGLLHRV